MLNTPSAGGGKSATCLIKNLDGINDPHFRCTIFRRTAPELKRQGGLIDESKSIYADFGGEYKSQAMVWKFKSGSSIAFSAINSDDDLGSWQGSQLTRVLIDEAADKWTEKQVLFLLSRIRSAHSKVYPQMILSCNPDINSFLKKWVDYSLGPDGVPVPGTEHRIRWFATINNQVLWADSPEECYELHGKPLGMIYARGMSETEIQKVPPDKLFMPKSFRFIPTGVMDNPYLLPPRNNSYLANLLSQPYVNQLRFLHGSWTAREAGESFFKREWVEIVDRVPDNVQRVRAYDFAASEEPSHGGSSRDPDYTAGCLMARDPKTGILYIEHMRRYRKLTDGVLRDVIETGYKDGTDVPVLIPKDPGAGGAAANLFFVRHLSEAGLTVRTVKVSGHSGKLQRAQPFFAMAEAGMVKIVRDEDDDRFIENMLMELEYFTGGRNEKNDQVDCISDATNFLLKQTQLPTFSLPTFSQASPIPSLS